jgi:transposase
MLVHRNLPTGPDPFLQTIAPSRADRVVCVACIFPWYGLAALGARAGSPLVLGHALYMQALHGGKATHDKRDAHKIAVRLRGGMGPQACVYPAAMRATRDLRRRRMHRRRKRADRLTHVQQTHGQYTWPDIGKKSAYKANRAGGAERFPEPAVPKSSAVDLALIDHDDQRLRDLEGAMGTTAKQQDAPTLYVLQTVPGLGQIRRLVLLSAIHASARFPRGQDGVSYCRLVTCAKESAGKRSGTSGTKIGNAYLKWACSEAAVLCLRTNPAGQTARAR